MTWMVACIGACLAAAPSADAACSVEQRRFVTQATGIVLQLKADAAPGTRDAAAVLSRARRRCEATRFALAVATATRRAGAPVAGRRVRAANLDLVGLQVAGQAAWRLDLPTSIIRAGSGTPQARGAAHERLLAAAFGTRTLVWTEDPTAFSWSASRQVASAVAIARLGTGVDRRMAGLSVAAFSTDVRREPIERSELLAALATTGALARIANSSGIDDALAASGEIAGSLYVRVAAAETPTWSQLDGAWSTAVQQRRLVARASLVLQLHPDTGTSAVVARLAQSLVTPPVVEFDRVPDGVFYPWPADGAWDTQTARIEVDKPGTLRIGVYDPIAEGSPLVRLIEQPVEPGPQVISWDGRGSTGGILPPGEYRWGLEAIDLAGNRNALPGPGVFVIARDHDDPVVRAASLGYLTSAGPRRFVIHWRVDEPLSPRVTTWLVVRRGTWHRSIVLDRRAAVRSMRRPFRIGRGTYRPVLLFIDGSGNRTSKPMPLFTVR